MTSSLFVISEITSNCFVLQFSELNTENPNPRRTVNLEVMKRLIAEVGAKNDPDLSQELTSLCKSLDSAANINEGTLEDVMYEPVVRSARKKRHQRNNTTNSLSELS